MAVDMNKINKDRKEACEKALTVLLEKYKGDNVDENERIIEYNMTGYGFSEAFDINAEEFNIYVSYRVTPYLEDSTKWKDKDYNYISFATIKNVGDELVVDSVREVPDNYDEFIERYENYIESQNNLEEKIETSTVQASSNEFKSSNIIENISYGITAICLIALLVSLGIIISIVKK